MLSKYYSIQNELMSTTNLHRNFKIRETKKDQKISKNKPFYSCLNPTKSKFALNNKITECSNVYRTIVEVDGGRWPVVEPGTGACLLPHP